MLIKRKTYCEEKPDIAISRTIGETFKLLEKLIGKSNLEKALDIKAAYPSPLSGEKDSEWIKTSKIIGINPRIVGSYLNIVKYAATFPETSIHIMPLWEAGCGGSIYARVNWKLSEEWLDKDLVELGYKTPQEQLKVTVNLLHALGKNVGFDAVAHTDKFSEEVFIIPECFEWIQLNPNKTKQEIFKDSEEVYPLLKECIIDYLKQYDCANGSKYNFGSNFFGEEFSFEEKVQILFGETLEKRTQRRIELMNYVRDKGFETIPVTEHAPCRPIVFNGIVKNDNGNYADFIVPNKAQNAKIFNSITPYRWYKIDNKGYPDIKYPVEKTFKYFIEKVSSFQSEFNFDFFRGDMAHNQISHSHASIDKIEDFDKEMWKQAKIRIQKRVPYFATFAEAFFNKYYIDGCIDVKNKDFDIALGYSNFVFLDQSFIQTLKYYHNITKKYSFSPCIASITNDSDRSENNKFHQSPLANELRYFIQMFFALPGYTGMGFEQRNLSPRENCEYSGLYTNYQSEKYKWGSNTVLFRSIAKIRKTYEMLNIKNYHKSEILLTDNDNIIVWTIGDSETQKYLCVVNLDTKNLKYNINYELDSDVSFAQKRLVPVFSLKNNVLFLKTLRAASGRIDNVEFGEARIYKIENNKLRPKNKNQILLVTTEYNPYAKTGGLADYCADFSNALKQKYNTDIRVIMPLYNSNHASLNSKNPYIEVLSNDNTPKRYMIEFTGIKVNYNWGIFESCAELYKIKNPINNVVVYLVYSPAFSKMNKEYEGNLFEFSGAYTASVCALLKEFKNSKEKFNPHIVMTNDYLSANSIVLIKNLSRNDKFYENIKTLHTIHNIAISGEVSIFIAMCLFFSRSQIDIICSHHEIREVLNILKVQFKINNSKESNLEVIRHIFFNLEELLKNKNEFVEIFLKIIINLLHDKQEGKYYNVTQKALSCSDCWVTVSECMYKELIANKYNLILGNYFHRYKHKGKGILSGLNIALYSPTNKDDIAYPYNKNNFKEQKIKNKLFIQTKFSKENINEHLSNHKKTQILGNLSVDENSILLLFAARAEKTKGVDIIIKILPEVLEKYSKVQIILAGAKVYSKNKQYFDSPEIQKILKSGRLLVIDDFIKVKQYMAAADFFLIPSRYETCGLITMQALRFGTLPISSLTGCADSVIVSPEKNPNTANGFKTDESLYENPKAVEIYRKTLYQALDTYQTNLELRNKLIYNAMEYDSSWNEKNLSLYQEVFKSI